MVAGTKKNSRREYTNM